MKTRRDPKERSSASFRSEHFVPCRLAEAFSRDVRSERARERAATPYVRRTEQWAHGGFLTMWTDGSLNLGKIAPMAGVEPPGDEPVLSVRPEGRQSGFCPCDWERTPFRDPCVRRRGPRRSDQVHSFYDVRDDVAWVTCRSSPPTIPLIPGPRSRWDAVKRSWGYGAPPGLPRSSVNVGQDDAGATIVQLAEMGAS